MSDRLPRVVFMGTPEFAVASLHALSSAGLSIAAVVTSTDKPAGRGKKLQHSAVKEYALKELICPVLQPEKLKDPVFISTLQSYGADIFVVVAFRMLPWEVWSIPPRGTINLHASLLPQYRGAAPINWSIINGETKTGVSTFLIDQEIDTGKILLQEETEITCEDNAGTLHDRLMELGSKLIVKTIFNQMGDAVEPVDQEAFNIPEAALKKAPRIFKEDCKINWNRTGSEIYNLVRGLSPYPCAYTLLEENEETITKLKIYKAHMLDIPSTGKPGSLSSDLKTYIHVNTADTKIEILELQAPGKKRMEVKAYLQGNRMDLNTLFLT
ncbi:methionyl-tRNA formyltransferase [Bacteroidota bacterium]